MSKKKIKTTIDVLFTIYIAGFNHGANEGPFPKNGTFEAFEKLIKGESPMNDNVSYDIKNKIKYLKD